MVDPTGDLSRRGVLARAAQAGGGALLAALVPAQAEARQDEGADLDRDREFVLGAGMTPEEATCWRFAAEAAGSFFALPELHPMDKQEVASAIHVLQNKLLSRPTYRRYLELARAAAGK